MIYIYIRLTYDKSTDLDISIYIYICRGRERERERERKQDLFYISINDISPMSPMEVFRFKIFHEILGIELCAPWCPRVRVL